VRLERNTAERRIRIEYRMRWRRPTGKKCHADATGPQIVSSPRLNCSPTRCGRIGAKRAW
jgi:hypothetical protein